MKLIPFLSVFILVGCAGSTIDSPPTDATYKNRSSMFIKDTSQNTSVKIRSKYKEGFWGEEFTGATCVAENAEFKAEFITPAVVNVPVRGKDTQPFTVTCTYAGKMSTEVAKPYNVRERNTRNTMVNGGLIGALMAEAIIGVRDDVEDTYDYDEVHVMFDKQD